MTDTTNVRDTIEVGDTVLLGSQRIRATVKYYNPKYTGPVCVQIDGIDGIDGNDQGPYWFNVSDVVEVIKPPKPMPEFQEGDWVRFRGSQELYYVGHLQSPYNNMIELWRLTAPDTLTKIWERKP